MTSGPEIETLQGASSRDACENDVKSGERPTSQGTGSRALGYRQARIIVLLFGGYAACYFCRADLSVATPLLIEELGQHGVSHAEAMVRVGEITSFGVLAYALGKLFLGG